MKWTILSKIAVWRTPALRLGSVVAVAAAASLMAHLPQTRATELTFDIAGFADFSNMSQDYGDNVTATTMGDFSYGATGGLTPNVSVSYGPAGADPAFWTTGYGDMTNVLFEDADNFGILEVTFTAAQGFEVVLHRWDMAAYDAGFSGDPAIDSLTVLDGAGSVLFSQADVLISEKTRTTFDQFAVPLKAAEIVLRFQSTNLGSLSDDVAIDNIVFSQTGDRGGQSGVGLVFGSDAKSQFEGFRDHDGDCHEDFDDLPPGPLEELPGLGVTFKTTLGRFGQHGPLDLPVAVLPWDFVQNGDGQIVGIRTGAPRYIPDGQNRYEIRFDTPQLRAGIERIWNRGSLTRFYNGDTLLADHMNTANVEFVGYVGDRKNVNDRVTRIELDGQQDGNVFQVGNSDNLFWSKGANPGGDGSGDDCNPVRVTFDPGNERLPTWDPRGALIAFTTDREDGEWHDIGGVNADGTNERLLAMGAQSPFGLAAGLLGWAGSTGHMITHEAVGVHEYLSFDLSRAPFTRTTSNGDDAAFTRKLTIDGGGGGGFLRVSRDGSTALWRFSRSGGGGRTTIHTASYSTLAGQSASSHGIVHVDVNTGAEQRFLQGAAIAPDGSFFILSQPAGDGHDLWKYTTDNSKEPIVVTTTGASSGALNRFPDISPDGSQIVFTHFSGREGDTNEIFLMNLSGGDAVNLTNTPNLTEAWPTWAPDGKSIAFGRSDIEGSPGLTPGEQPNTNIYTLCLDHSSDGGNGGGGDLPTGTDVFVDTGTTITYQRITSLTFDTDPTLGQLEISGDGSKVIYSTGRKNIYTMNADGSERKLIFKYSNLRGGCPCLSPWVAISHDGSQIAWTDTVNEIFTANSDGSNQMEIATTTFYDDFTREPIFGGGKVRFGKNGKLYYQLYMGRRGEAAGVSGMYEINPDGSGQRRLFSFLDLWPVVPKDPDQSVDPGEFAVSDGGIRIILNYDLQNPSSFFGPGAFRPGAMVTWDDGSFRVLNPSKPEMNLDVEISGDGRVIAYEYSAEPNLFVNTFAGTSERSVISVAGINSFDFRLNDEGTVISADTGGTGGSVLTTLLSTDGAQRLDLMPDNTNDTPGLVRMTAKGTRLVWFTGWKRVEDTNQVWTLDINPKSLGVGFPEITSPAFNPSFVQQDGTSTTVMSATMVNATDDTWFAGMLDGELRSPFRGGIGRFSFDFFDDGADNDPVAGDGRFFTKDAPAFRDPDLGTWTIRMGAQNGNKVTLIDVPGMRVVDGLPEELKDTDNDGVSDFFEAAFGTNSLVRDSGGLPTPITMMADDEPTFGVTFTVAGGLAVTAANQVEAGGFIFSFELSQDVINWRPAGADIVISAGAVVNGRAPIVARLAGSLLDADGACYVRTHVRRK